MNKKVILLLLLAGFILSLFSCGKKEDNSFTVVTTTNIITDVVQNITGENAEVLGLIIKGQNPHSYEPSPREMARLENADLIFVNGFGLEENLLKTLENIAQGPVIEVSQTVMVIENEDELHDEDENHAEDDHAHEAHDHGGVDPHTWMSPRNVMLWTEVIYQALSEADPRNKSQYRENADAYIKELKELDDLARDILTEIPQEERVLVTDHNVFNYLARDYGFTVKGSLIPGFSTNAEISSQALSELIHEIKDHNIPAIFISNTAPDSVKKLSESLQKELDHKLKILPLMSGSLAAEGETGDTYIKFMEYNIQQIHKGLIQE